jgi:ABC-type bacteriocin/lantibiotic exporter with double-glycine peptidase domain
MIPMSVVLLLCTAPLVACASYAGKARDASAGELRDEGWRKVEDVPWVLQEGERDCGPAALGSLLAHHGIARTQEQIRDDIGREGSVGLSAAEMRDYLRAVGLQAFVIEGSALDLRHEVDHGRPLIVGVVKPQSEGRGLAHYEVLVGYHVHDGRVLTLDPAHGLRINTREGFEKEWSDAGRVTLVALGSEARVAGPEP